MLLKIVIVLLFIAMVISLFTGFGFMVKDQGSGNRSWIALGFRLLFASLLFGTVYYGLHTGKLQFSAPWDATHRAHDRAMRENAQHDQQPTQQSTQKPIQES